MKILLIYANKNRFLAPAPLGLAMVADSVNALHDVEFMDFMFEDNPEQKALCYIQRHKPDLIGISIRILDSQDSRNTQNPIVELKRFIEEIRHVSQAPIVLGGTAFTTFPAEMLEFLSADYGIAGQGEKVFPLFVRGIERGMLNEHQAGLVFRKNGKVITNPSVIEGYPDSFTPARVYYNPQLYARTYWPGIVLIKSGCPFSCVYCDNHITAGREFKLRSPEAIVEELKYQVHKLNTRVFHLSDPCFNTPLDYAKMVLEGIIKSNLKIVAMTTCRPDNLDGEIIVLMKRAGIIFVGLGADTLSQTMLENYQKGFSIEHVEQSCRLLQKGKLGYMLECVFGGPGETLETLEESFNFLDKVRPSLTLVYAGLRILPDTGLYQIALNEGVIQSRSDLLLPTYYFSPYIDKDDIYRRIDAYNKRYGYRNARMARVFARKYVRLWLGRGQ